MSNVARGVFFSIAVASAAFVSTPALALECIEKEGLGLGFVLPFPGCERSLDLDFATSAAIANSGAVGPRVSMQIGYTVRSKSVRSLHIGPVMGFHVTDMFGDPTELSSFDIDTGVRARYWLDGKPQLFFVEGDMGPMLVFPNEDLSPHRVGFYVEGGASIHGGIGAFVRLEPTWRFGDRAFVPRYALGVKSTIGGIVIGIAIYACARYC